MGCGTSTPAPEVQVARGQTVQAIEEDGSGGYDVAPVSVAVDSWSSESKPVASVHISSPSAPQIVTEADYSRKAKTPTQPFPELHSFLVPLNLRG